MTTATATHWQPLAADEMAELFPRLAADWHERARYMSNTMQMAMLRPYQRIIGMGPPVLPLIFAEVQKGDPFWRMALEAITGEDPVPEADRGSTAKWAEHWLAWGRANGYIA